MGDVPEYGAGAFASSSTPTEPAVVAPTPTPHNRIWPHLLVVSLSLFAVYAATASHSVGLEDDGLFILAGHFAGIAHPPGYPLYVLISHLFSLLPFGTAAFKAHIASAALGAAACASLWWCVWLLVPSRAAAYSASIALGLSATFWSQSIVAEVYSLNVLFFFLLLGGCLQWAQRNQPEARDNLWQAPVTLAFLFGLSLSNHWPLIVLASPAFLIILWPHRNVLINKLPVLIPALFVGLSPYVWMAVRSWSDPLISFYGPINSVAEFWFVVSRKGYANVDTSTTAGIYDKIQFLGYFLNQLPREFTLVGLVLGILGFVRQGVYLQRNVVAALVTAFLTSSVVLIGVLGFDYDGLHVAVFRVYPMISLGILAIWIGLGVHAIVSFVSERAHRSLGASATGVTCSSMVALALLYSGWSKNDQVDFTYPSAYALAILESLPRNAILFASDDASFGPVAYMNILQNTRPDVTLYQIDGLVLSNRIFDPLSVNANEKVSALRGFLTSTDRPVFSVGSMPPATGFIDHGLYISFQKDLLSEADATYDQGLFARYEELMQLDDASSDWLSIHRGHLSYKMGWVLAASTDGARDLLSQRIQQHPALTKENLNGILGIALGILSIGKVEDPGQLRELLELARAQITTQTSKRDLARFFYAMGGYALSVGDYENAIRQFRESLSVWPDTENESLIALNSLYGALGRTDRHDNLKSE